MSTRTSIQPPESIGGTPGGRPVVCSRLTSAAKSRTLPRRKVRSTSSDLFLRILGSAGATIGEKLLETAGNGFGHELVHFPAEGRDLLYAARRDEAHGRAGHHGDRLDVGRESAVQLVHPELPPEVPDHPEPSDD